MAETHEIAFIKPKPSDSEILRLTGEYFDSKGQAYDRFEQTAEKRDLFTKRVNELIEARLPHSPQPIKVLSVACGTGRREIEIAQAAGREIEFTGIELSSEMCRSATSRGINAICGNWLDVDLESREAYDAALLLSAFGHIPSSSQRVQFLSKIAESLHQGAPLFLDVLNLRDKDEWGPKLSQIYDDQSLEEAGFERGDVMYRKIGEPEICYYHYFSIEELTELCEQSGFTVAQVWYVGYGANYGEVMNDETAGAIVIEAKRAG